MNLGIGMSVSLNTVFTDIFNAILSIIDQIALAVQSNAQIIATVVIIGALAGSLYYFGRRMINWFRGFLP